jgi:hypothetical protein
MSRRFCSGCNDTILSRNASPPGAAHLDRRRRDPTHPGRAGAGRAATAGEPGEQFTAAGAETKLAQLDQMARRATTVNLGMPSFGEIAGRDVAAADDPTKETP